MTLLFALVMGWEVIRVNLPGPWLKHWPWRLRLVGIAPSVTLTGVFAGLLFARSQYASSVRPFIGWRGSTGSTSESLGSDCAWTVKLVNAGPGQAIVEEFTYSLRGRRPAGCRDHILDGGTWRAARDLLRALDLTEHKDFALYWLDTGAPIAGGSSNVPVELVAMSAVALQRLSKFSIRLVVRDMVGDTHERTHDVIFHAREVVGNSSLAPEKRQV